MDKQTVGTALLSALQSLLNKSTTSPTPTPTPIILIGHDRGARIAHRLAVTGASDLSLSIKGASLIDIVPTAVQWQHDAGAPTAAAQITGYFHWPFLANVDLAVRMIGAFGPAAWCEEMTLRWAGSHGPGLESLKADEALGVYGAFFAQPRTLRASCEDYEAGAGEDVEAQVSDREKGRRIEVPVLLIYSKDYIGSRYDMGEVWNEWIAEGVKIDRCELGGGVGHFGVEEAPGESAKALGDWIEKLKG
jgi:pimeloyl-ACP methyl ester carboxylesterase